jgi:A/G-specific adenine glycosylase
MGKSNLKPIAPPSDTIQRLVLLWYRKNGRDLPWRHTSDPYAILVSEIMLQQTQVERVIPKYLDFLHRFPTIHDLAQSTLGHVLRIWAPLGYNIRAVRIHEMAIQMTTLYNGIVPDDLKTLRQIRGIGPYTASAIACFAYGMDVPVIDINVKRVLTRLFQGVKRVPEKQLQAIANKILPAGEASAWNQSLMDLGATICKANRPRCIDCPVIRHCKAAPFLQSGDGLGPNQSKLYKSTQTPFIGSRRFFRGRIVDYLRSLDLGEAVEVGYLGTVIRPDFNEEQLPWLMDLLQDLNRDSLATLKRSEDGDTNSTKVSLPI